MEIYILDKNTRERIAIIDNYKSLIWCQRYNDFGDCEIYTASNDTERLLTYIQIGNYIQLKKEYRDINTSDEYNNMICYIYDIEYRNSIDEGNYFIIKGRDIKELLNLRIIENQNFYGGSFKNLCKQLINENFTNPKEKKRVCINMTNGDYETGALDIINEQFNYENIGNFIKSLCVNYEYGFKMLMNDKKQFVFYLYQGADVSNYVIFSKKYDNLVSCDIIHNIENYKNYGYIGGERIDNTQSIVAISDIAGASGIDRREIFIDGSSYKKEITYNELMVLYPMYDEKGTQIGYIKDKEYYYWYDEYVAHLYYDKDDPSKITKVVIVTSEYERYLVKKGSEELKNNHNEQYEYESMIESHFTFKYGNDYKLGDIVRLQGFYNDVYRVRIIEMIEVWDENGYSNRPTFKYVSN